MGAYNRFVVSCDPRDYSRRLERAKRARAKKRESVHAALAAAGFVRRNGIWVAEEKVWPK